MLVFGGGLRSLSSCSSLCFVCLKIMANGAVAHDGRLCVGQRILEVCWPAFDALEFLTSSVTVRVRTIV